MSSVDILVPHLPESVADATVTTWRKRPGDIVKRDEVLVEIETDKVVLEVLAPEEGLLEALLEDEGATVTACQVLGRLRLCKKTGLAQANTSQVQEAMPLYNSTVDLKDKSNAELSPAMRRLISEHDLNPKDIIGSGVSGRMTREDVESYIARSQSATSSFRHRSEKRVPMTRLRKRMAERLLEAKNNIAMLTTFNEVNMQAIIDLRKQYGKAFEKRHGIRLGFMSFYINAVLMALKRFPEVNASLDGDDVVYYNYFDVSIAVSTARGLVTPVLKDIDGLSMADIENKIKELSIKGNDGKLKVEELTGGNFTVTNGGVFGSLMSTPIINPPQSAILGIHAIKYRPMAVHGQVVILPMVYLALSYDHRLIDGKESVSFLITVKEMLEEPNRFLLDV
ncbi:2-oxoglutarate dehydrogenase complex dihydrolipoyllysine-residue succinyltransferase [Sodalis endosymbiont of Henestaris halophilus]|uniref:2-oxoglutarate dehydrogenase complex dihydrolipoyllysine-residue succinyltransferase n=1 Tax=Sodalis endosymbiont of Henestaris halophilus TaxID=1929246 RepID=UPI000BBF496E|nr:2-oxoglutarate dehydrogenase complex dihydrolipoyllysine-residue succinyltransferase [Sodalis endosymbiont of Henestaris halophilus]SNC59111.1 Dihydrolipoyllysine-residue succinyltransferase component of 2-oxoglutarate dehydrogenase complex [Sodalis endosymbiont of Henestaris halophilus]